MTAPPWWDRATDWTLPPPSALGAGDVQPVRCFATAEEAMRFIAPLAANAARQRRHRARQRDNAVALRLTVPAVVVAALIETGRLNEQAALDPKQVEREAAAVLTEWSNAWGLHF